jgi:chromosomal replication initiation ATPase DnaA
MSGDTYLSLWKGVITVPRPMHTVSRARLREVVTFAAEVYRVGENEILSGSRLRHVAHARQYAIWLLRETGKAETGRPRHSFPAIGKAFGLDHSTCVHAWQQVEKRLREAKQEAA